MSQRGCYVVKEVVLVVQVERVESHAQSVSSRGCHRRLFDGERSRDDRDVDPRRLIGQPGTRVRLQLRHPAYLHHGQRYHCHDDEIMFKVIEKQDTNEAGSSTENAVPLHRCSFCFRQDTTGTFRLCKGCR